MPVIPNRWIEKARKKRVQETAAAYGSDDFDTFAVVNNKPLATRQTSAARAAYSKTLRGVRK